MATSRYLPSYDDHLRLALRHVRGAQKVTAPWELPETREQLEELVEALLQLGAAPRRKRRATRTVC